MVPPQQGNLLVGIVNKTVRIGLYWTSRPVRKSGNFSKSGLYGNRTFCFPDAELLKIEKKSKSKFQKRSRFSLFIFGNKFVSRDSILCELISPTGMVNKVFRNISLDSVRSGSTCPANLGVQSCPVRKLTFPVQLSPT